MSITSTITDAAREARRRAAEEAIHSSAMEGLDVDDEFRSDADAYVAGTIDSDELVRRTRASAGLA